MYPKFTQITRCLIWIYLDFKTLLCTCLKFIAKDNKNQWDDYIEKKTGQSHFFDLEHK